MQYPTGVASAQTGFLIQTEYPVVVVINCNSILFFENVEEASRFLVDNADYIEEQLIVHQRGGKE